MLAGKLCCSLVIDHCVGAVLELAIVVEGSPEPQIGVDEFDFRTEDLEDVLVQERPDSRRVRLDLRLTGSRHATFCAAPCSFVPNSAALRSNLSASSRPSRCRQLSR